ncbi:ribonuclease E activity regulator RraA [Ornithinimicrobium cavernae]|uniref:ribonuclease E activity regulator RraA n=1 Tax=Ornithinimicrobium cavernae TaxID=2666047 RepID=UPI000D696B79|nr:ribonuclease E activity regulator RraA [Ornithinimicrobium cavernae]
MTPTPGDVPATADLWDEYGDQLDSCDLPLHRYGGRRRFAGRIVTLRAREDNRGLKALLDEPGEGRVIVVDGDGSTRVALLGDLLAARAAANGWAGIIIHGAVRDVEALAGVDLGVVALGSNPRRSRKETDGERDVPVSFGGARFEPGDWVAVDADGVVVHRGGPPHRS